MKNTLKLYVSVLMIGFSSSLLAQASAVSVKELSEGSELILSGKVVKQNSRWDDGKNKIYTYADIKVEEYFKGEVRDEIVVVKYLGGEVGDIGELYTHMPSFKDNEEVVVFLKAKNKEYSVYMGESGKITVADEEGRMNEKRLNDLKNDIKKYASQD